MPERGEICLSEPMSETKMAHSTLLACGVDSCCPLPHNLSHATGLSNRIYVQYDAPKRDMKLSNATVGYRSPSEDVTQRRHSSPENATHQCHSSMKDATQ
jgi:hypothetical protein